MYYLLHAATTMRVIPAQQCVQVHWCLMQVTTVVSGSMKRVSEKVCVWGGGGGGGGGKSKKVSERSLLKAV